MEENKTYEIGFLLSPLLPEDKAGETVERLLKAPIAAAGGVVVSETSPKMTPLAYRIRQVVENKAQVWGEAYFGSLRFSLQPEALAGVQVAVKKAPEIIRSLIVVLPADVMSPAPRRGRRAAKPAATDLTEAGQAEPVAVPNPAAAIDQEIDNLLHVSK